MTSLKPWVAEGAKPALWDPHGSTRASGGAEKSQYAPPSAL
ncbi:hypothetical protein [Frankia nepalensis]|nr:hypothetical protein [Frankia nepalensis]